MLPVTWASTASGWMRVPQSTAQATRSTRSAPPSATRTWMTWATSVPWLVVKATPRP